MKIYQYNGIGEIGKARESKTVIDGTDNTTIEPYTGTAMHETNYTMNEVTLRDGEATIQRQILFESEKQFESGADVLTVAGFPEKYSAHPLYPQYKYYGNGRIYPAGEHSKIWIAELEYSTSNPSTTDIGGGRITADTPPWKLFPDNIQFTYPEFKIPFRAAYDNKGNMYTTETDETTGKKTTKPAVPVVNSAGDIIAAERTLRNIQMSFTYAVNKSGWKFENALDYGNTINLTQATVCEFKIPAGRGLLLPPEANFITVYKDGSSNIKWQYWSVNVTIMIDMTGLALDRRFMDVGNRAIFDDLDLAEDAFLAFAKTKYSDTKTTFTGSAKPGQIGHFRLTRQVGNGTTIDGVTRHTFIPDGEIVFCSFDQFIQIREMCVQASLNFQRDEQKKKIRVNYYEPQWTQDSNIPLNGGKVYTQAIPGMDDYKSGTIYNELTFREFAQKEWKSLNLPKKRR